MGDCVRILRFESEDMTMKNINWYPGHMKKTRELILENLKLVDVVIEVVDGRIPISSRNPIIDQLVKGKDRIIVLNKSDLSDVAENKKWLEFYRQQGIMAATVDCLSGAGVKDLLGRLGKLEKVKNEDRVRKKNLRIMIVGVPNVGKSTLINRLTGRTRAQTGARPGGTKGKQWLTLKNGMQLLDTPGILWPKFEDPMVGVNLAYCGSIKDEILPIDELGLSLIEWLSENYPENLRERYKLEKIEHMPLINMENIAVKRGFVMSGNRIDYERTARTVLDEFRGGKIGRISLEVADDR